MDLGLAGHRVIVSAGAAGIGREIVAAFLEEGARVAACDVDGEAVARLRAEAPEAIAEVCDVSDPEAVRGFVERAAEAMGGIDTLV